MRLSAHVLTAALLTGALMGCSSEYGVPQTAPTTVLPVELRSSEILAKTHADANLPRVNTATFGIYATSYDMSVLYGYPFNDRSNGPPVCTVGSLTYPGDIAVDRKGDLLVVNGDNTIRVYKGPGLCGAELGSIADPFGYIFADVASRDGQTIVASYDYGPTGQNGVAVCTLSGGCTRHLHAPGSTFTDGVAVAPNGDCWASGTVKGTVTAYLAYFAHCQHNGVATTGFQNTSPSTLDIDANGNLVATDASYSSSLYIYSGCNPACTLVGGPFQLKGTGVLTQGRLDANSHKFIAPDSPGKVNVYSYSTSGLKYLYSFSNGLTHGYDSPVAAFSPNSKE